MSVLVAIRDRMLWADRGKDGLQRNLGKKWRKTNGLAHTHSGSKSTDGRTWLLGRFPNLLETQMVCRKLSRTTRVGCILLKTVEAGSNSRNVEGALYRWLQVPRGPMRVVLFDGFDGGGAVGVAESVGSRAQKR